MRNIVDTILPTTMVGSYPRPDWFKYQLLGRDARVAFKHAPHEEAYADATRVIIQDQEEAGLDIVTDGQMYFDDYIGSIGSFCWYMYERIPGFDPAKEEHPAAVDAATMTKEILLLSDWGGVVNSGPIGEQAPLWLVDFYKLAKRHATSRSRSRSAPGRSTSPGTSISALQGPARSVLRAGAAVQFRDEGAGRGRRRLPAVRGPRRLAAAVHQGHRRLQVDRRCGARVDGVDAKIAWHFCYGNAWGNRLAGLFPAGYEAVLPYFYDLPIDQFVLDFANRDMVDIAALEDLPKDKEVAIGVIDVRTSMVETPEEVAERIRKVIAVVLPERVYSTTDCGMKPLSRMVARMKLKALADGAKIVRQELGHA